MKTFRVTTGAFQAHTWFLMCERTRETLLIDPGQDVERLLETIELENLKVTHLVGSHAHLDHVWSVAELKAATGAPFYLHPDDEPLYQILPDQGSWFGFTLAKPPAVDIHLRDGDVLTFGDESVTVRHVPGHSPGHVMLIADGEAWVGDCVFESSIGRTDLPGGSSKVLLESIHRRILALGDEVKLHPGHGPSTTVGKERRSNPFLNGRIGPGVNWTDEA